MPSLSIEADDEVAVQVLPDRAVSIGVGIRDHERILARSPGIVRTNICGIRCLIPGYDGAIHSLEWKQALWDRYVMAAPRERLKSAKGAESDTVWAFVSFNESNQPGPS